MATLKSLLQTAIDTRVGQALPKEGGIAISYTPVSGAEMWDSLINHDQAYTPPSDGWICFYAVDCKVWAIQQGSRLTKLNATPQDDYSEGGVCVPVRKGVLVNLFFEYKTSGSRMRMSFYPCLQS